MAKNISFIPAKAPQEIKGLPENARKRACAYCRVSTDSKEQESSYETQVAHYTAYIKNKPDLTFVDIYADEGISGTSTKKRDDFNRMIKDCMEGKIDIIITKSISRFARNTLDCLNNVRKLKDKGIAVFFEKENINTLETNGEVLLTILSSLAQDESRSISENVKWGIAKKFQNGRVLVNTTRFLGYDKDENGELIINEEQAKIVRRIFSEYLEGKSYNAIAKGLMADGIKTVTGNNNWWDSTITGILTNEKYYGDVLLQKTYTIDYLNHKRVENKGYVQQVKIEQNHEPIIPKEVFDRVQDEKERRALLKGNLVGDRHKYTSKYAFSGKVVCSKCGNNFKRRTWNSKSKYKKIVWQCKTYVVDGKQACDAKAVDDQVLMDAFVRIFNKINENKDTFIKTLTDNIGKVLSGRKADKDIKALDSQIEIMKNDLKGLIKFQIRNNLDDGVYKEEYIKTSNELEELRRRKAQLEKENSLKDDYRKRVDEIIQVLAGRQGLLEEFDDKIFNALVEKIEVLSPTHFVFVLKSGMRVEEIIPI